MACDPPADRATDNASRTGQRTSDSAQLVSVSVEQFHMGMTMRLTVWAPSRRVGQQACANAFERVREINQIMSDYEPESELSQLCRRAGSGPVSVSSELFDVVALSVRLAEWSDGAFDPTIGPVTRLWRDARQTGDTPDERALQEARLLVGYQHVRLNADAQTVELALEDMLLDLGAIAKGVAGDEVLRVLRKQGITRAAFEAGGDTVLGDAPPHAEGWPVDPNPWDNGTWHLANCAVSISADTIQYVERDGQRYSHVVDPRSGLGVTARRACYVVAPHGRIADPLATLGTVMPPHDFDTLLETHFPDVQAEVIVTDIRDQSPQPRIPPP